MYYEDLFKPGTEPVKLIITNLNDSISDKIFYEYFSRWGQIGSFKVMRDIKTNLCRGFGYITYTTNTSAIKCFHDNPHSIGSNKVNVSTFRIGKTNIDEVIDKMDSTCIMLSYPLSYRKLKEEKVKEYFSKYPSFKCIVEGGYGCSFVYFNDPKDVNFIICQGKLTIDGCSVIIKKAIKKEALLREQHKEDCKITKIV
ncbi:RNA recognition motif domain and Nucleotide-binding, alpha-beta plait domain-containing protein [Strongyloides ratti]|uniref:RNA recognition motif domain and Nucleotide-binding, alpha-beta plait domain-containing protein n=1 Tax=Strongyloides ratti TaxID=34506 RepID=A0A090LB69_STRRB|nr:RNA recognition motif domain and Nucleotide-binding, alpha-beta plait domain-containing protein [Strongyloides ratti]CEF64735.1 RNA recognition motif domain and Nucleotide-binding, alpha-beta plait domain-containing protein [Strongyloides ratti]